MDPINYFYGEYMRSLIREFISVFIRALLVVAVAIGGVVTYLVVTG